MERSAHIIAHRGASREYPENRLPAFERAIALGAHRLEFDLHLSKDGFPICHHDLELHVEGGPSIEMLTRAEIQALDPAIPTLSDLLRLERGKTGLMVELKRGQRPKELIEATLPLLASADEAVCVGSLCPEMVGLLTAVWPRERVIAIVESEELAGPHLAHRTGMVAFCWQIATPTRVRALKEEGRTVWVWTVDEIDRAQQLLEWGADGIITNDPARLLGL